jgi:hypothetical protein
MPTPNKKPQKNPFFRDDMSNELYFSFEELAFLW